jgi:predicted dehydrogenase
MRDEVRKAGVKTIVSFCLHWNPSLMNTRNLIDRGAIGEPYYVEVDYWHGMKKWYPQYPWAVTKSQGGSRSFPRDVTRSTRCAGSRA